MESYDTPDTVFRALHGPGLGKEEFLDGRNVNFSPSEVASWALDTI